MGHTVSGRWLQPRIRAAHCEKTPEPTCVHLTIPIWSHSTVHSDSDHTRPAGFSRPRSCWVSGTQENNHNVSAPVCPLSFYIPFLLTSDDLQSTRACFNCALMLYIYDLAFLLTSFYNQTVLFQTNRTKAGGK